MWKKIVTIGGGTGMSTMLRGLKAYTKDITAIVTMADDGGGSGRLREELGVLPPGDIRNCLLALADAEPMMEKLFHYRFPCGTLSGQSVGNLIIAAMDGLCGSLQEAISSIGQVLAISGTVLPVTEEHVYLSARLADGAEVLGESRIGRAQMAHQSPITSISLVPALPAAGAGVLESIAAADAILLGPGSLYTSVIPNLLVSGVADALRRTKAPKIYICNVMGQPGETAGYTAADHVRALLAHGGEGIIEYCIANESKISPAVLARYEAEGVSPVPVDKEALLALGVKPVTAPLCDESESLARHNPVRLARFIMDFLRQTLETKPFIREK